MKWIGPASNLLARCDELPLGLAAADDQTGAAVAQLGVELRQALEQELRAWA